MELDESFELIEEVLNNRTENRVYDYYLNTLVFSLFSNEKPQTYSKFKSRLLSPNKARINKMTNEEKKAIHERNNKILNSIKVGEKDGRSI